MCFTDSCRRDGEGDRAFEESVGGTIAYNLEKTRMLCSHRKVSAGAIDSPKVTSLTAADVFCKGVSCYTYSV